jgi:5-methyltetrahydropteroyltriglutamate--homocysteine methyltransferase
VTASIRQRLVPAFGISIARTLPSVTEISELIERARNRLDDWQIWVNPDCGLKTRRWEEVQPALINMVQAARQVRKAPRG